MTTPPPSPSRARELDWPRELITDVTFRYQRSPVSLFRRYQDIFLDKHGKHVTGHIVELGGERHYNTGRFFPNASRFTCTNIARDCDEIIDITAMPYADASQDAYVCTSVLAHVFDFQKALREISRTLKPGGQLLLTAPFAFPHCEEFDFWRFSLSFYGHSFDDYDVKSFANLGGLVSTIADVLQRPKDKPGGRYRIYKQVGVALAAALGRFDTSDGFPLGYGLFAVKR